MREDALDNLRGEALDKAENIAEEGADEATDVSKENNELDLDRSDDDHKERGKSTENELLPALDSCPGGRLGGLTLSKQAKSLAMAAESRTPPTLVHRILSNGREARA